MNALELLIEPRKRFLRHPHYHFVLVSAMFLIALGLGIRDTIAAPGSRFNILLALTLLTFSWIGFFVAHVRASKNAEVLHSVLYGTMLRFLFVVFAAFSFLLFRSVR